MLSSGIEPQKFVIGGTEGKIDDGDDDDVVFSIHRRHVDLLASQ
jgi:hypothetical protein